MDEDIIHKNHMILTLSNEDINWNKAVDHLKIQLKSTAVKLDKDLIKNCRFIHNIQGSKFLEINYKKSEKKETNINIRLKINSTGMEFIENNSKKKKLLRKIL